MALIIPSQADEPVPVVKAHVLSNPVIARSLADACDIVRLINDLSWKDAKSKLSDKNQIALIIEPQSKVKDWHGVGAYRGSVVDAEKKQVRHRFSYGIGRLSVHEIWITYSYSKDSFQKPSLHALGW